MSRKGGCFHCGKYWTCNDEMFTMDGGCCSMGCRIRFSEGERLDEETKEVNYKKSYASFQERIKERFRKARESKKK